MSKHDMTEIERAALARFAARFGHQWKAYLKAAWMSQRHNGREMGGEDGGTLREIRNQRGMRWLDKIRTADLAPPPASVLDWLAGDNQPDALGYVAIDQDRWRALKG